MVQLPQNSKGVNKMAKHDKKEVVEINIDGILFDAKECSGCQKVKELSFYHKGKSAGGKSSVCKQCHKEKYLDNKEDLKKKQQQYYIENKEKILNYTSNWQKENKEKKADIYKKSYEKNKEKYKEHRTNYQKQWEKEYPEKKFENRCKSRNKFLPYSLKGTDYLELKKSNCFLSGEKQTEIDHFISMSTGHGGTYKGNLIKLSKSLNKSKGQKNPFEWIETRNEQEKDKFKKVIEILATENNLTVLEFIDFVNWCYENPRKEHEFLKDSRNSLEIWRGKDATTGSKEPTG